MNEIIGLEFIIFACAPFLLIYFGNLVLFIESIDAVFNTLLRHTHAQRDSLTRKHQIFLKVLVERQYNLSVEKDTMNMNQFIHISIAQIRIRLDCRVGVCRYKISGNSDV